MRRYRGWKLKDLSYRTKLFLTYALIVVIPLSLLSGLYYSSGRETVSDLARQNLYSIVKQNNEIIDAELTRIEESSLALIGEQVLYEQYLQADAKDGYRMVTMEKEVSRALNKYFPELRDIYSIHLMTSYGNISLTGASALIPYDSFAHSALYQAALEGEGDMRWVPTFSYSEMFDTNLSMAAPGESFRLLAGVRLLRLFQIDHGHVTELEAQAELPVLLITYRPEYYESRFTATLPSTGASFFVLSKEGERVAGTELGVSEPVISPGALKEMVRLKSGTLTVLQDGKPLIICFDTSKVTGWISGIAISPEALGAAFLPQIKAYTFYLALFLLLLSLLLAFIFANSITQPIQKLLRAIKKTGEGEFDTRIPVEAYNEMGLLIHKFNQMNGKINQLIEENYKVKLREKETQIMALNVQLNPHFLYNTLNMMNWTALENGQAELSRMIVGLSSMLQYTSQSHRETGDFTEELQWLESYIYMTSQRFENKFTVTFDISPELYSLQVPKLFLQPFVENAIVHGFARRHSGGRIVITGRIDGNTRVFTVEDNGCGIPPARLERLTRVHSDSIGIQNVDSRIKLIYGETYGVTLDSAENQGTRVNITLPAANK
ncbi:sensor histidine kinase [Paenibacillus sanguinis]|uniref:sensor histidine kinase n=1 Tax=Paenibacillus sanguinis TaxID=225906 RepID=UPI0003823B79|nr:sensor histidine kinase [Paenibacillus sanguinis]